jgi:polysaccharide biosynthesis protein PslG
MGNSRLSTLDASPFGINSHAQPPVMEKLAAIGVGWHRIDIDWDVLEPLEGVEPHWDYLDAVAATAEQLGLSLLGSVAYTPAWARSSDGRASPPRQNELFVRFVRKVVERYRGRIPCLSIWNEPDGGKFWSGTRDQYLSLLLGGLRAAREANPDLVLCGPDLSGWTADIQRKWMQPILDAVDNDPSGPLLDVITHHQYGGDDKLSGRFKLIADLQAFLASRAKGDRPLWITEIGWNSKVGGQGQVTAQEQADLLRQVLQAMQQHPWWAKTFWYDSHGTVDDTNPAEWGVLAPKAPYAEKPAFRAYAEVIAASAFPSKGPLMNPVDAERRVRAGYQGILARDAEPAGVVAYLDLVRKGQTVEFCRALFGSPEFHNAARTDPEVAETLYRGILGRPPDPGGLEAALVALRGGQGPEWAAQMLESDEFKKRLT